jgi:hypothetical protein
MTNNWTGVNKRRVAGPAQKSSSQPRAGVSERENATLLVLLAAYMNTDRIPY